MYNNKITILGGIMTYSILDENILLKTNDNHYFTSDEWEHYEHATKEDIETFK